MLTDENSRGISTLQNCQMTHTFLLGWLICTYTFWQLIVLCNNAIMGQMVIALCYSITDTCANRFFLDLKCLPAMLATNRPADVTPEANLRNPLQACSIHKACKQEIHPDFETQGRVTRNPKQGSQRTEPGDIMRG